MLYQLVARMQGEPQNPPLNRQAAKRSVSVLKVLAVASVIFIGLSALPGAEAGKYSHFHGASHCKTACHNTCHLDYRPSWTQIAQDCLYRCIQRCLNRGDF